ncbi:hypothetical protein [uncultured Georgenia sp.]|uniref:hypothetical protein n=1 Tax=uncultured Georgenia sp. TaxID=378209 RepID=UPI0026367C5C|nr:hypothetical protein [uncultured Georgenia sp.]HLV04490.1 hypothetical protein [Actinomycetaceae bacterium]
MIDDQLPLLDRALAEPRHLLVLSAEVHPDEVEALAVSHFDDAGWVGPGVLRLTREAQLTGPWRVDDALRAALDLPPWATAAMLLRCPVERSSPIPPELRGLGGLLDAFPEGEPVGLERLALEHLLGQARRLAGALRVAGTGTVLVPDPASAVDLTLHTTVWLEPEACARVLAPLLPGLTLPEPVAPQEPPSDRRAVDVSPQRARAAARLDEGERAWLHAEADALDAAVLAQPQVVEGYALEAPVPGGVLEVGVAGDEHTPLVLRALPWARGGVISYEVRWRPDDPAVALGPRPPLGLRRARDEVRATVERVVVALHAAVGGQVVDDDGFLVAVDTLG